MDYRIAQTKEEFELLSEYASRYDFTVDPNSVVIYAVDEGKIKGLISLKNIVVVEPLISENSLTTHALWNMALGILLSRGVREVRANTKTQNVPLYERLGFDVIFPGQVIMEKELSKEIKL